MTCIRSILIVAVLALFAPALASAQNHVALEAARKDDHVALAAGLDHAGVVEARYARRVELPALPLLITGALQLPTQLDLADGGLAAGASTQLDLGYGFALVPRAQLTLRWLSGDLLSFTQGGVVLGATGGYYHRRFMAGLDVAWDKSLFTHARPTDRYRRLTGFDAGSELYASTGGSFRLGVATSLQLYDAWDVELRGGVMASEEFNLVPGLPLYVMGGTGLAF